MKEENDTQDELPNEVVTKTRPPSLMRNYVSFVGIAIATAAVTSDLLLFLIEITSATENAYIGILTYIILPSIMMFGLFVVAIGMILERRRRRTRAPEEVLEYPMLDLNNPHTRRSFMVFMVVTLVFISASAFGSYKAFEYSESVTFCGETCHSVMKPEFLAYKAGAHARVRCVDCHVGSGADWYVRSKLSGAYQLYSVSFNKYSRPIGSPVHNLRPAPETCEQCHWPEKFFGGMLKVFDRFGNDEKNTLHERRLLLNVGGSSPATGKVTGIHWHVNPENEVNYVSIDERRQEIPWVSSKDKDGKIIEYFDRSKPVTAEQLANGRKRKMDCVDCHNRPAHMYLPPDLAVDKSFAAGKLDQSLPYLKRQSVALLSGAYETNEQALAAIDNGLREFYRVSYPDISAQRQDSITAAALELQRIYQNYFFPEMKTNWQTHPNNAGHLNSPGCFRCHDGQHFSNTGKVISNDCNICHTTLYDSDAPASANMKTGPFIHPVDLGALADRRCDTCHQPDKQFKHPINLGDISQFQCAVCHPRK